MNVLFMTIGKMDDIEEHTIYCDLLRYFRDAGHSVYTISPYEKRTGLQTAHEEKNGIHMLHVRTGNVTGMVSLIEKGLAQLSIEPIFIKAIKKYYSNVKFDLVMYSTPPITFCNAIEYVKRRDNAKTYLLLKDIFPQNAVDIGMMSKSGIKGILYKFFRNKEKKLYGLSDYIGCMSPANVEYVKQNNPEIDDYKVEVCPNCIEVVDKHCEFDGVETVIKEDGKYCCVPVTHKVTLGEIVDLLQQFKEQPTTLMMPKMPEGSFAKKLYSLYLTYLPTEKFKYALKMNVDDRGSFTELVHTQDCGQVSINISRPGITKGQHWHNSKWELFIVVAGHGLIQERNINTGEKVEFEVSGDKIEAIHMIPGWTHNIINLSETENLVTVMTCNEIFNPERPDTFFEEV